MLLLKTTTVSLTWPSIPNPISPPHVRRVELTTVIFAASHSRVGNLMRSKTKLSRPKDCEVFRAAANDNEADDEKLIKSNPRPVNVITDAPNGLHIAVLGYASTEQPDTDAMLMFLMLVMLPIGGSLMIVHSSSKRRTMVVLLFKRLAEEDAFPVVVRTTEIVKLSAGKAEDEENREKTLPPGKKVVCDTPMPQTRHMRVAFLTSKTSVTET